MPVVKEWRIVNKEEVVVEIKPLHIPFDPKTRWQKLYEQILDDMVERVPPNGKEEAKKTIRPEAIIWNLFNDPRYLFSATEFKSIYKHINQ